MSLGRFQVGDLLRFHVRTVGDDSAPTPPDEAPLYFVDDPDGATILGGRMAMNGSADSFAALIRVGLDFPLGTYRVSSSYKAGGVPRQSEDVFSVIRGGDPGGKVVSMSSYERPEGRYLVAQLETGRIVQGRNPHL